MDGDAGGTAQEREDECSVHVSGVCAHCTTDSCFLSPLSPYLQNFNNSMVVMTLYGFRPIFIHSFNDTISIYTFLPAGEPDACLEWGPGQVPRAHAGMPALRGRQ